MKKGSLATCIVSVGISLLSGCVLYRKAEAPPIIAPSYFKSAIKIPYPNMNEHWWENFKDGKLNLIVKLAIDNNLNYHITIKNIEIARTYVSQYFSTLFPQVNLNYNLSRNEASLNELNTFSSFNTLNTSNITSPRSGIQRTFNLEQLFGSLTYEIDVWNQIGNTVRQAKANVIASEADSAVVKLTLISSVVTTYFQITTLNADLVNLKQQYQAAAELLQLTNAQYKSGLVDIAAVDDARNQLENIKTSIINAKKQREVLQNTLAYLVGEYPENFSAKIDNVLTDPGFTKLIPPAIPSLVLANRPDIQGALFRVLAADYFVKQNIANFLPSFNITGNYGYATTNLADFISNGTRFWNLGLNLVQPILDFGLRHSEYKRSKLQYQSAILTYRNTVINAFNEVNSALSSYQKDYEALHAYKNQVINSKEKLDLACAQYQAGLGDYSTYLTYDLTYLQNSYNLINQQLAVAEDIIQVYKTLGIGLY